MKNKSTRHKEINTFKFQPFAERIANLDVDVFHKIGHEYETESEEIECHFHQAIEKWTVLNLTESFTNFKKEVKSHTIITLPQLVLDKDRVIGVLLRHLSLKNALSLQPLLDIVVAVAKDLRRDFYVYYKDFLAILISLLHSKDADQLEWVFTCLAYLFKFLWRPLLKDITLVFDTLLPLLSNTQPEYVNSFAAGSFAFVTRKVKDRSSFLQHLLKVVKHRKDGVEGCGKLLFEMMHGVSGQFHSCAEINLQFLLESLSDTNYHQVTLFEILEQVVANIVASIQPQHCAPLWSSLINAFDSCYLAWTTDNKQKTDEMLLILKLIGQGIEHRHGKMLSQPTKIIELIVKTTKGDLPEKIQHLITQIVILLLTSSNIKLTQEQASTLIRKVLMLPHESVFLYFIDHISDFSSFEALILPQFLKQVELHANCAYLHSLTKLILKKSPPSQSGINLNDWRPYSIDFGTIEKNERVEMRFIAKLNENSIENYVCTLICLPNLKLSKRMEICEKLADNCRVMVGKLDEEVDRQRHLFILNCTIEALVHLNGIELILNNFDLLIEKLLLFASNVLALKTIDLIMTVLRNESSIISVERLLACNKVLEVGFSSPLHLIRLHTAHIYTLFENLDMFTCLRHSNEPDVHIEKFNVFSICFACESIDSQVDTYRNQVQNLDKFNFDKPQILMANKTCFNLIPLRYLCGVLYINFKLLWEPISKIIETHAHGLEIAQFWSVFGFQLHEAQLNVTNKSTNDSLNVLATSCDFINELYQSFTQIVDKTDFCNYRLLLWKTMGNFGDVAEARTRDVSELVLDFIECEYTKNNAMIARNWNIKQNSPDDFEHQMEDGAGGGGKLKKVGGQATLKTLLHVLIVLSKIKSPKSMYREPEIAKLYFDLLEHKNPEVQKLALDCLMTYKHKYLMPYKDNLYNLVDDKNYKNELSTFKLDKDSGSVREEHRNGLVPIVMRIVFSKMSAKAGLRTGGKASGQVRRNLVFRFLAGCEENEMLTFVQMSFRLYHPFLISSDPLTVIANVNNLLSLDKFIPPKRLQSTVNLLNVIVEQFGGLMSNELLAYVFNIVLVVGQAVQLSNSEEVHSGYLSILKTVRNGAINIIERFFAQFERYPWSSCQINAIFDVFVWPYLTKLETEGIHSPTSLLKLLVQFGTNPRYFTLLVKVGRNNEHCLPHVIRLLLAEKSHISVVNAIEEMIEKLISLQPDQEDQNLILPVGNTVPIAENILERIQIDEKLNYGSCILFPHIAQILAKIQRKLATKNKNLSQRQLFILSRISELVWESEISDCTLKLLLPVVLKRCTAPIGEEVIVQYLQTIRNLVGNVNDPKLHLKKISCLFSEITLASGRRILIDILRKVCSESVELIEGVNAFDLKWIEQPDFQRRHDTFKLVLEQIDKPDKISLEVGVLLIHTCFYLLKSEKDLSLKESSSHCLKQLIPYLINAFSKESDYLLNETVLTLIRNAMKSRSDDYRNEIVQLLGHLARENSNSHVVLRDLRLYTNKSDLEVDFFENITHLQLHRHARALLRLSHVTVELSTLPNVRTLTQFVLPLVSHYLCCEKYASKNSVLDAAIQCIGTICRILPWHQYEGVLKYYLAKLRRSTDYQKQLVRIIVVILEAFHFDLSKASTNFTIEPQIETIDEPNVELDVDEVLTLELDEEEEIVLENVEVTIGKKITILCKSTATRVVKTIQHTLLPQLHKTLAEMTQHESSHKLNRKKTSFEREEEDLLRVPISLALVKLLQRLPIEILDLNLPGILMKTCTFLKTNLEGVRRVARDTLQKIMQSLGPNYLCVLLSEMMPLLSRGFHSHVLVYTTHSILSCLKVSYRIGDIDKVLLSIVQLCQADLFGVLSDEKEVRKIGVKTSEAKQTKSFDTFQILAEFITDKCLMELILPIKNVLETSHSFKMVHKAQECLRHIVLGLVDNKFINVESLLKFAFGTASGSVPQLMQNGDKRAGGKVRLGKVREDCFIIPKAPVGRSGVRVSNVKVALNVNAHLLVEFGLRLCYTILKRDKIRMGDYKPFLDPFVVIFKDCLNSKHVKLSTLTLQCLHWLMKYDLPSMKENISDITKDIFGILHKYAAAGLSKGDNFDLVVAAFKAMAVLVRDIEYYTIETDQLKVLLLYAEQDMHDYDRQATAFNLLKAIVSRKLIVPEIDDVMTKVAELSVTAELDYVRSQARAVFHQYLMFYPIGDKLDDHLGFYMSQLDYEMQYGRESAIEMLITVISTFPIQTLKKHSGTIFVTMGARLVNDEVPSCRKKIADALTSMLQRLNKNAHDPLFDICVLWLKDNKVQHRRLAAQLCGIFINVEKANFETRLPQVIPLIMNQFGLDKKKWLTDNDSDEFQRLKDHHLFQVLQMCLKLAAHVPNFLKRAEISRITQHVQTLLGYPHDWVRLGAAQFIGYVLAGIDVEYLSGLLLEEKQSSGYYLQTNPNDEIRSLTLDLCDQLQPNAVKPDLAEQVIKNLIFVARVVQNVPSNLERKNQVTLLWLTKRVRKIVNSEVVEAPSSGVLRTEVFRWIGAVVSVLEVAAVCSVLRHLLAPLVREMITTEESNAPLRQLAKEVGGLVRKKVGLEVYTSTLGTLQQSLSVRRAERKRGRSQLAVVDPEAFAKKKLKRHGKKKEAKKRRVEERKGTGGREFKRRRRTIDLDASEVM